MALNFIRVYSLEYIVYIQITFEQKQSLTSQQCIGTCLLKKVLMCKTASEIELSVLSAWTAQDLIAVTIDWTDSEAKKPRYFVLSHSMHIDQTLLHRSW